MSANCDEDGVGSPSSPGADTGDWVMPPVSYVDPTRRYCEFCGRPIARKYWRTKSERSVGIFCDPAHAALNATYPGSTTGRSD